MESQKITEGKLENLLRDTITRLSIQEKVKLATHSKDTIKDLEIKGILINHSDWKERLGELRLDREMENAIISMYQGLLNLLRTIKLKDSEDENLRKNIKAQGEMLARRIENMAGSASLERVRESFEEIWRPAPSSAEARQAMLTLNENLASLLGILLTSITNVIKSKPNVAKDIEQSA